MRGQRFVVMLLALLGVAYAARYRKPLLLRVPTTRKSTAESSPAEPEVEEAKPTGHVFGWTFVVVACTAVVAGGALALAIRTALWHKPAVATASAAAPAGAPSAGSSADPAGAASDEPLAGLKISKVSFAPGELKLQISNPQSTSSRIGLVTVNDAIVVFSIVGKPIIEAGGTRSVVAHYDWVNSQPVSVGVTTGNGIESTTDAETPAA